MLPPDACPASQCLRQVSWCPSECGFEIQTHKWDPASRAGGFHVIRYHTVYAVLSFLTCAYTGFGDCVKKNKLNRLISSLQVEDFRQKLTKEVVYPVVSKMFQFSHKIFKFFTLIGMVLHNNIFNIIINRQKSWFQSFSLRRLKSCRCC